MSSDAIGEAFIARLKSDYSVEAADDFNATSWADIGDAVKTFCHDAEVTDSETARINLSNNLWATQIRKQPQVIFQLLRERWEALAKPFCRKQ